MKALKTFLAVILVILIIPVSICTVASVNARVVFANPTFYRVYLTKTGTYDALYDIMVDYFANQAFQEQFIDDQPEFISDVLTSVMTREEFGEFVGNLLGDAIDSIVYNRGELEMPLRDLLDDIVDALEDSPQIAELDENIRNQVLDIAKQKFTLPAEVKEDTLREYLYFAYKYDEEQMEQIDYVLDDLVHSYAVRLTNLVYVSSAVLIILLALLYLVTMDQRNRFLRILSEINVFYILVYIIIIGILVAGIIMVPLQLQADQHYTLQMASDAAVSVIKSVLYVFVAETVLLIILKIVLKRKMKANRRKDEMEAAEVAEKTEAAN